ncbi:MAG: hypothetical protein ACLT8H_03725 [Streptococcus parasanguinis]
MKHQPASTEAYLGRASVPNIDLAGYRCCCRTSEAIRGYQRLKKLRELQTPAATEKQVAPAETKKAEEANQNQLLNAGSSKANRSTSDSEKADETSSKRSSLPAATTAQP